MADTTDETPAGPEQVNVPTFGPSSSGGPLHFASTPPPKEAHPILHALGWLIGEARARRYQQEDRDAAMAQQQQSLQNIAQFLAYAHSLQQGNGQPALPGTMSAPSSPSYTPAPATPVSTPASAPPESPGMAVVNLRDSPIPGMPITGGEMQTQPGPWRGDLVTTADAAKNQELQQFVQQLIGGQPAEPTPARAMPAPTPATTVTPSPRAGITPASMSPIPTPGATPSSGGASGLLPAGMSLNVPLGKGLGSMELRGREPSSADASREHQVAWWNDQADRYGALLASGMAKPEAVRASMLYASQKNGFVPPELGSVMKIADQPGAASEPKTEFQRFQKDWQDAGKPPEGMLEAYQKQQAEQAGKIAASKQNATITAATKTMRETAPKVLGRIAAMRKDLAAVETGPFASRFQEGMNVKGGLPNPPFVKLRADADLLTSILARMHTGARSSDKIMAKFDNMVGASRQSAANMRATLDAIESYAREVAAGTVNADDAVDHLEAAPAGGTPGASDAFDQFLKSKGF